MAVSNLIGLAYGIPLPVIEKKGGVHVIGTMTDFHVYINKLLGNILTDFINQNGGIFTHASVKTVGIAAQLVKAITKTEALQFTARPLFRLISLCPHCIRVIIGIVLILLAGIIFSDYGIYEVRTKNNPLSWPISLPIISSK